MLKQCPHNWFVQYLYIKYEDCFSMKLSQLLENKEEKGRTSQLEQMYEVFTSLKTMITS